MRSRQRLKSKQQGLVYVFTGDGKGKTSAAIGVGVRAAISGMKVAMVCWYKEARWPISELGLPKKLKNFEIYLMGKGFHIHDSRFTIHDLRMKKAPLAGGGMVIDRASEPDHKQAAREALKKARELIGKADVLILDEVNNAVADGLIDLSALIDLISKRGRTHLVLTGRGAHRQVIEKADLVTEMRKIKHPYDRGRKAVKGLDF